MLGEDGRKYGRLALVRGDKYGKPREFKKAAVGFTTLEFNLEREMHDVFCAMAAEDGSVPSRGVQEIREGRQHPWRIIARRFREAHAAGVDKAQLYEVVQVLMHYVARLGEKQKKVV